MEEKKNVFSRAFPCALCALWFCICACLAFYAGQAQEGLKLAPSILYTIDDELRGLLPYCALKHPQILLHVNPRFLFGAVQAALTNAYVHILHQDLFMSFRFTSALFSSLTVYFMFKITEILGFKFFTRIFCFLLLLSSPLFLFFSISGFETVFCAFLVTLFFYLYLRKSITAACFVLGLAPLVRLETLALCAVFAFLCVREKRFFAAALSFLPFALFTAGTRVFFGHDTDKSVYDILVPANFPHRGAGDITAGYLNLWNSFGDIFWVAFLWFAGTLFYRNGQRRPLEKTFLVFSASLLVFLTASYFYSSAYSLCGRYWIVLFPAQCLFIASVWQNDIEPRLRGKQKQNIHMMIAPVLLIIAYTYIMAIHKGLPAQNSDNQFVRAPHVTKSALADVRKKTREIAKHKNIKTIYLTWEFYDPEFFVENHCEAFDMSRVLWGPPPEGWTYWTKSQELTQDPCGAPYLDFTTMETMRGLPKEPFLLVTTSRWFEKQCPLAIETVFQDTGIRVYRGGLLKR